MAMKKKARRPRYAPGLIGERLRAVRESYVKPGGSKDPDEPPGITLLDAMILTGIYSNKLSLLERNHVTGVDVSSANLARIVRGYGCSADYLLGLSDTMWLVAKKRGKSS